MKSHFFIFNTVGLFCQAFSITLIPPIVISSWYHDGELQGFGYAFAILSITGTLLWAGFRNRIAELRRRDGFLLVALFWILSSMFCALPLVLGPNQLDLVDSIFEATSGITTTGATVIPDLDSIPPSILFYRQELQWIGGMGLIVLAIAVLPMLGVGGAKLFRAETPGPMKEEKLTPRLAQTARNLWLIYTGMTLACSVGYWWGGMTPLEGLEHAFATVSTGGFSTHDESLGYYQSDIINYVAVVFMVLAGINFGIHFSVLHAKKPLLYVIDVESRTFLGLLAGFVALYTVLLLLTRCYSDLGTAFEFSLFEITSVMTSTGFGITDFSVWPLFFPLLLMLISFIGGCGGSTAGGIKVIRVLILFKQMKEDMFRLLHPKAIRTLRIGGYPLDARIMWSIWGFFSVYVFVFVVLMLAMMLTGLDQVTAFTAVASCINNLGPGLGEVTSNFAGINDAAKLIGVIAMLLGRLEIFTLLVIMMPEFWRS